MKSTSLAIGAFLAQAVTVPFADAFIPVTLQRVSSNSIVVGSQGNVAISNRFEFNLSMAPSGDFIGMDDDDDEDDEDEDDEDELATTRYSGATSPFTGMKLDPWDPNPLIKPRPSRIFKDASEAVPDDELVQTMAEEERKENLTVMRQIRKSDLPDLKRRKDHAGWVEANNDLKRRYTKDPWFPINERLRDAMMLGDPAEKIEALKTLTQKLGGPPPGIEIGAKGYAVHTEVYDIGMSPNSAASMLEREIRADRAARGRVMMGERRKNMEKQQQQYEEDMRNPGVREDREAKERRERTMRRLMGEIEEDNKKKRERAQEILGKIPETPSSRTKAMEKALGEAREEVKKARRKELGRDGPAALEEGKAVGAAAGVSSADKAREAAAAEAAGGRPRLPGDADVTQGEISIPVEPSSSATTGPLQVEVSSTYNKEQSDPPMRKHCFQYTIRITNNSPTDTIQLLGRRFEIQTVGSSMKDVVQGEGVTGRTPILKPGEVFEYTSTAPLSVRPIGTTEIAARMRGEYRYVTLAPGQETASEDQIKAGGESTSDLGTFHFIFPDDQRVKPFRAEDAEEEDEEDEDEDDEPVAKAPATSTEAASRPATAPSAAPASTLPGDDDIKSGDVIVKLNDSSELVSDNVRVAVTSSYRPERSDNAADKHCFAYNIRITNEAKQAIQLVSRRFEIQTIGSDNKDVVQGPGVTGRQPILKPGESFEYTSTAPLSVKPILEKTPVVARMQGEYNFVVLGDDGATPLSSSPLQAKLGMFHFILPAMA
jgi:ApaG protein